MGGVPSQGEGAKHIPEEVAADLIAGVSPVGQAIQQTFALGVKSYSSDAMVDCHLLDLLQRDCLPEERTSIQDMIDSGQMSLPSSRAVGCLLGLVVGDALGAPLEFVPVDYSSRSAVGKPPKQKRRGTKNSHTRKNDPVIDGLSLNVSLACFDASAPEWANKADDRLGNRFSLEPGQWTDDGSMALCLADSLIARKRLDPLDLRLRFLLWWRLGYCNPFALDRERAETYGNRASVGLGETIGHTISEFEREQKESTATGRRDDSGNGSIMRNAPVAIRFCRQPVVAMEAAWVQSKTTHLGDEAADCARLLTFFCSHAITDGGSKQYALDRLASFPASVYSVGCLARAEAEERHLDNQDLELADRDWQWRVQDYRFSSTRADANPEYVGSYCMDAMAMALHCLHVSDSFEGAVARAANTCGDADTVAAVTGQLAGAIYGVHGVGAIPDSWRVAVQKWDRGGDICVRAYQLYRAASA